MAQAETTNTTTRRSFLSAAVVAAVLPTAVLAQTDPIFAAVERHRAAFKAFAAASVANDTVAAVRAGLTVTQETRDQYEAACEAEQEACAQLVETIPLTCAGIAAAITWLAEYDSGCVPEASAEFMLTLLKSPVLR